MTSFCLYSQEDMASAVKGLDQSILKDTFLPLIPQKDSVKSVELLNEDFNYILNNYTMNGTDYSIMVYSLDRDTALIDFNSQKSLTPASLTKLFTTFNAMQNLGADYKITTKIWTDDSDLSDGIIDGNLYFEGRGDALFNYKELDTLFQTLKIYGIHEIAGDIYIDNSFFDNQDDRFKYSGDDDRVQRLGKITAFAVSRRELLKSKKYFVKFINEYDIEFGGELTTCSLPKFSENIDLKLLVNFKRPLVDMIKITNKRSDNFLAEHIFKMNGAINDYSDNDWESSRELLYRTLDSLGVPVGEIEINDGSGLSRRNLTSARAVVSLLKEAHKSNFAEDFHSTLAIAGKDGTLKSRLSGSHAENNLVGKTGTLRNASGLSGYVKTLDGENLAFAFIFNGSKYRYYKQVEDELANLLAGFFYFNQIN